MGERKESVELSWTDVGIEVKRASIRDLWAREDLGMQDRIVVSLDTYTQVLSTKSSRNRREAPDSQKRNLRPDLISAGEPLGLSGADETRALQNSGGLSRCGATPDGEVVVS